MARILFFGRYSDMSDNLDIELPVNVSTAQDLAVWLGREYLALDGLHQDNRAQVAINGVIVDMSSQITDSDEIAYLSPLSGG